MPATESAPLFGIAEILGPLTPTIRVCAVGAMYGGEGHEPHDALITKGLCSVIGFEPIQAECDRLNQLRGPVHRFLPYVIGDGRRRKFHVTNQTMTSSIYSPNGPLLKKFQFLDDLTQVVAIQEIDTHRLDDLPEIAEVDFLKIDAQGATLDVLTGAERSLRGTVVVHAEAEFVTLYVGEPTFAEVDRLLRHQGFAFHKFAEIEGATFRPLHATTVSKPYFLGQQLWADVVYAKDFMRLAEVPPPKLRSLAVILHEIYRSVDFCAHALDVHDRVTGSDFWMPYVTRLTGERPPSRPDD